jgi:hypothetical protein
VSECEIVPPHVSLIKEAIVVSAHQGETTEWCRACLVLKSLMNVQQVSLVLGTVPEIFANFMELLLVELVFFLQFVDVASLLIMPNKLSHQLIG